jgi:hypothetical protein
MNKLMIIPFLITSAQIISIIHLYYTFKNNSTQIPAAFIELNILAFLNAIVLILAYFLYFKSENKLNLWYVPISIAIATILSLLIVYIVMFISKYK